MLLDFLLMKAWPGLSVWEIAPQYAYLHGVQPYTSDTEAWLSSTDGPTAYHPAILGLDL